MCLIEKIAMWQDYCMVQIHNAKKSNIHLTTTFKTNMSIENSLIENRHNTVTNIMRHKIIIFQSALQAATILVAMASGKNLWRPKFWRKSPIGDQQIKEKLT